MTNWYAIQVRPAAELKVAEALKVYGVAIFVPVEKIIRRSHGRKSKHKLPLLRGYVFAALPLELHPALHDIEGANGVLTRNGKPAVLNTWSLAFLWLAEDAGVFDKTKKAEEREFASGDRVRLKSGPYLGRVGIITKVTSQRRAQIILDMVTANWPVSAPLDDLEPEAVEGGEEPEKRRAA